MIALLLALAALLPQDTAPKDVGEWMRRQDAMLQAGAGEKAVAEANARAEKEPKSAEAQFLLGRILGNTGNLDGARTRFRTALDIDPAYAPAWRGSALAHFRAKEYDVAVREARRAFELDDSPENRVLLVECLYQGGDRPGAHRLLADSLARTPGDHDLRAYYANVLLAERSFREAERELRQVLASAPGHLGARQMLVVTLMNTGRRPEAIAECREFARRQPKDAAPRRLLIQLLVEEKDWAGAAAALEEFLRFDLPEEIRESAKKDLATLKAAAADQARGGTGEGERKSATREVNEEDLLRKLDSKDVEERRAAVRTMSEIPLNFLPSALLRRAGDEDELVRLGAVKLIGRYGEPGHLVLLDVLLFRTKQSDPSVAVRTRAVGAVGAIESPAGLVLLVRALDEPEPEIRAAVLRGIRDVTGRCLVDDPDAPLSAKEAEEAKAKVVKWWFEDATARQWRKKCAAAIAGEGIYALAWYLPPWILEEDAEVRAAALEAFAVLSGDRAWKDLPTGTKEERETARVRAYAFLAEKDKVGAEK